MMVFEGPFQSKPFYGSMIAYEMGRLVVHQRSLLHSGGDCRDPSTPWGRTSGCLGWAQTGSQTRGHTPRREPRDQTGISVGLVTRNQTCRSQSCMYCRSSEPLSHREKLEDGNRQDGRHFSQEMLYLLGQGNLSGDS